MAKYFEHSIPAKAPAYIIPSIRGQFELAARRVHLRMDSLEEALQMSGLRGEVFAAAVLPLFKSKNEYGDPLIDAMMPQELADSAKLLSAGCLSVPDRIEWPNCNVVVDTAFVTNQEWEALRMLGLGGSDSANVVNEGFTSAANVYHEKVGTFLVQKEITPEQQFLFDYGHCVETLVIDEFCRRTGAKRIPETRMFCHKDYPFLTANIDQIVQLPDGTYAVFEAKTTTFFNRDQWAGGAVPRHYIHQCRKYPLVLNDDRIVRTYIGCIFGNTAQDFCCSIVERDKAREQEQLETEVAFWNEHVLAKQEPLAGGNTESILDIAKMKAGKGNPNVPTLQLDEDQFTDLLASYMDMKAHVDTLNAQVKAAEESMDIVKTEIIQALGDAETAVCAVAKSCAPGSGDYVYSITYKGKSGTSVNKERLKMLWPDAYQACVTQKTSARSLSVKVKRGKIA